MDKRGGWGVIDSTLADFIIAKIGHAPHVRATRVWEGLGARFGEAIGDRALPTVGHVRRWMRCWKRENRSLYERLVNPDQWKNTRSVALGHLDADVKQVNERWRIDSTPSDNLTLDALSIEIQAVDRRLRLNCSIDVISRYPTVSISPTVSGQATRAHLRKALPRQGVPGEIWHDWGSEYENDPTRRAMILLGIGWHKIARPYSGNLNGPIEAFQKTLTHNCLEELPGYVGHSVVEAQAIRSGHSFQKRRGERRNLVKLYNIKQLSTELGPLIDEWIDNCYLYDPHSGLLGSRPIDVFCEADGRGLIHRADERVLDLLLGDNGIAVVGRRGIRFDKAEFWDDALIPYEGQEVQFIRTQDAGVLIVLTYDPQNNRWTFICNAVCPERQGIDRHVVALMATEAEKRWVSDELARMNKRKREQKPENIWREVLDDAKVRASLTPLPAAGSVMALPYLAAAIPQVRQALDDLGVRKQEASHVVVDNATRLNSVATPASDDCYDEEAHERAAVERYARLLETDRAQWSEEDKDQDFMELAGELPSVKAFMKERRRGKPVTLSNDECEELLVAVRRKTRPLTAREQFFIDGHVGGCEAWATTYESSAQHREFVQRSECKDGEGRGELQELDEYLTFAAARAGRSA